MIWNHPYRHAYNKQSNEAKLTFVGLVESLCPTLQGPGSSLYLTLKGFYLKYQKYRTLSHLRLQGQIR